MRLCRLEKQHKVLEVGFGPGLGLKAAAGIIEAGTDIICFILIRRLSITILVLF